LCRVFRVRLNIVLPTEAGKDELGSLGFLSLRGPGRQLNDQLETMDTIRTQVRRSLGRSLALVALLGPLVAAFPAARDSSAGRTSSAPSVKETLVPFRAGEKLDYRVSWSAFSDAASVQLSVPERRDLFGWQTWHFRAVAHTLSPVRSLFQVDDQFDSYTDTTTLESRQYEMHLNELGKITDKVLHLAPSGPHPHAPGPTVLVLPGTRDPLGAIYALRGVDWQRTPEFSAPVYDGIDLYEMRAQRDAPIEAITVDAGTFPASRISIRVFSQGKELSATHLAMWLANDAAHTPVLMEADLPFGNLRVELIPLPK
jgi:hypothetical protein